MHECALYRLIMRSDKPEAAQFQDWVSEVVLPTIRRDGGYILGKEKVVTGEMSEDVALEWISDTVDLTPNTREPLINMGDRHGEEAYQVHWR
ncbi:hypothetical protein JJB09_11330 [Rhizobium sp. KVB221]|uniref:Bro-N domain-containing protein n=1 Tax=Rhizobium setariae TaxID=2801340 RepID=A0A937CKY5_9HYPH|nr:hypothetical protein [Rhizobium setariae]